MSDTAHRARVMDPGIRRGLWRLGVSIRLRLLLRGLGWVVAAVCLAAWASLLVDFGLYRVTLQHLGTTPRLLVDLVCGGGIVAVAWKRLFRVVFRALPEEDLAILVERGHPQLQDRLISALQFSRVPVAAAGESPALAERVFEEARAASGSLRFLSVLRMKPVWTALLAAAILAAVTGGGAWAGRRVAGPWAERNLLMRNVKYPRQTILRIAGGPLQRVIRGDPLKVVVTVEPGTRAPKEVEFHMAFASIGAAAESIGRMPGDAPLYVKMFPVVTESFRFFVTGNDDQTDEVRVELVEPPELKEMELEVRSPLYTGVTPRKIRQGAGMVDVPDGGVVAVSGLATKDLSGVRIFLDDVFLPAARLAAEAGQAPRRVAGEFAVRAPTPFRPSLALRVELRDTEGFVNPKAAAYSLVLRQDQAPVCQLEAVDIGGEITSDAVLKLVITAKDDYGVAGVHLEWGVQSAVQNVVKHALKAYLPAQPEPETLRTAFDLRVAAAGDATNLPPLQVGETLRVQAVALDSFPTNGGGPLRSPSNLLTFRIVTAEDVMAKAMDAKRSVREQVRQAMEMQTEVAERSRGAARDAALPTTIGIAQREIGSCWDAENQILDLMSNAVSRLEGILEQLRNNRAVSADEELWLRGNVVAPLGALVAGAIPPIVQGFSAARSLGDSARLAAKMNELIVDQERLIRALEAIVKEMEKFEDAQQVEKGLRAIIRLSDQVRDAMKSGRSPKTPDKPLVPEKKP